MTDKTARPVFQPAPRPQRINDAGSTETLREATQDLGFNRRTSAEPVEPVVKVAPAEPNPAPVSAPTPAPVAMAAPAAPAATPRVAPRPKPVKSAAVIAPIDSDRMASLKLDIDDELSMALKMDAVKRRVTVKYLILEALAGKGYPVNLAEQPEDGRRVRK